MKRQRFLETFLVALGAKQILWTAQDEDSIFGTVIYDMIDTGERQDFVWHMTEDKIPDDKVIDLIEFLTNKNLIDGDKIKIPIEEIEIPNVDHVTKNKLFNELFSVIVNMIDNGKETDCYFMHD